MINFFKILQQRKKKEEMLVCNLILLLLLWWMIPTIDRINEPFDPIRRQRNDGKIKHKREDYFKFFKWLYYIIVSIKGLPYPHRSLNKRNSGSQLKAIALPNNIMWGSPLLKVWVASPP